MDDNTIAEDKQQQQEQQRQKPTHQSAEEADSSPSNKRRKLADNSVVTDTNGSSSSSSSNDDMSNPSSTTSTKMTTSNTATSPHYQRATILGPCKPTSSPSASTFNTKEIVRLLHKFPLSDKISHYGYGTAGFRFKAQYMEGLMIRVGIITALRAFQQQQGEHVGVMVTASHNDESYNGVKIADPHGGMLAADYEIFATKLVNERDVSQLMAMLQTEMNKLSGGGNAGGTIHIGRDTRAHSPSLSELVVRTALSMGATVIHHGVITTPILHHCVLHSNAAVYLPLYIPPRPTTFGYLDLLAHSYWNLIQTSEHKPSSTPLIVDCACGVGYPLLSALYERIQQVSNMQARTIIPTNSPNDGPLNDGCGSEYVQKQVKSPAWYDPSISTTSNNNNNMNYCASLDGDSDRIVFFDSSSSNIQLLDGDKIAVLICEFIQDQLNAIYSDTIQNKLKLGIVQTAYANGASTQYLKNKLGEDNVLIAKTGVKHVHHAAEENFDIGIYFEANGHGTVIFDNDKFMNLLQSCDAKTRSTPEWQRLRLLPSLINPAVGDALSDLLLVDAILTIRNWTIGNEWKSLYQDFPSRQMKVSVPNPKVVQTNSNETRALSPPGLQSDLDQLMKQHAAHNARTFVRPSGTEAVVRIYAEASSQVIADKLATEAERIIHKFCDGGSSSSPRGKL